MPYRIVYGLGRQVEIGKRKKQHHHTKRRMALREDLSEKSEKGKKVSASRGMIAQNKPVGGLQSPSASGALRLDKRKAGYCFLLFLLLVRLYWPAGTRMLRQLLIPGASETAFSSMAVLAQELWEGKPVRDVVEAYCRTILMEAGIPDG